MVSIRDNVVIGCSGYNDVKGLTKLIEQTHEHVKEFIYVDGVYDFFNLPPSAEVPKPERFSTDGSRELCAKYDNVHLIEYAGYQPDKRQKYGDRAARIGADVLIVLDTDEWVHPEWTNWDKFYDQLEAEIEMYGRFHRVWNVMLYVEEGYELAYNAVKRGAWTMGSGRIWYRPEELEYYAGVHYFVRRKETDDPHERLMSTNKTIDQGVRFTTSTELRTPEFRAARDKWAKSGMDYEEKLINQYNSLVSQLNARHRLGNKQALYPLICVMSCQDNPEREKGIIQNNDYADILFIKYDATEAGPHAAIAEALKYFRRHSGYTHLAITTFDMNWGRKEYDMLYKSLLPKDYTVLSGYTLNSGGLIEDGQATFSVYKNKMSSNRTHPTIEDIQGYIKLYRQDIIDVSHIEELTLTFIRNDIIKFIGDIKPEENKILGPAQLLSQRLRQLGIPQYVNLNCKLDCVHLSPQDFPLIRNKEEPVKYELHIGKYGKT